MKWLWSSESSRPRWQGVAILALIVALGISIALGGRAERRNRATQRALEAAGVESLAGAVTARDEALEAATGLLATIEELKEIVPEVRIVETIRTVSEPINASLREMVLRQKAEMARIELEAADRVAAAVERVKIERPECSGFIRPSDCPELVPNIQFHFTVASDEVRLESEAGNTFAVGLNTIYEGDCTDMGADGCQEVGFAPWRSDLSRLVAPVVPARTRLLGWYAGVSWDAWQRDGDHAYAPSPWRVRGGPELAFKRVTWRVGVVAGPDAVGVDLGASWHGDR